MGAAAARIMTFERSRLVRAAPCGAPDSKGQDA